MLVKNKNIKEISIKTAVTILVVTVAEIENTLIFRWIMDWYEKQINSEDLIIWECSVMT